MWLSSARSSTKKCVCKKVCLWIKFCKTFLVFICGIESFLREDTRKVKEKEYMHKWSVSTPEQRVHFYSTTHPVSRRTQEPTHAR